VMLLWRRGASWRAGGRSRLSPSGYVNSSI